MCLQQKQDDNHDAKVFRFRQQIRTLLSLKVLSVPELQKALDVSEGNKKVLQYTLRLMLDEGSLRYNEAGCLELSKEKKT